MHLAVCQLPSFLNLLIFSLTKDIYLPLSLRGIFFGSFLDIFIARYLASLNLFSIKLAFIKIHQYKSLSVQRFSHLHFHDEQPIIIFDSPYLCCISEEGQLTILYYCLKCILTFFMTETYHQFLFLCHTSVFQENVVKNHCSNHLNCSMLSMKSTSLVAIILK